MTAPPPPRVHAEDSDPSIPEALRRVRQAHQERPQLTTVPGLHPRHRVRGFVAQMIANADTLSAVRRLVGTVPMEYGADSEAAETAELVVSELVGNAVRACGDGTVLVVEASATDTGIEVAVHDPRGDLLPTRRETVSDDAECGRGLQLLDVLAPGWIIEPSPLGKQIRCHIRAAGEPLACDWCGQGDHDPIKPQDGESVAGRPGAGMTVPALSQPVEVSR